MNEIIKSKEILDVFLKILPSIQPTSSENQKLQKLINQMIDLIQTSNIPDSISISYIEPEGSTGIKQTALKNAADIDLFIALNPEIILKENILSKAVQREKIRKLFKDLTSQWLIPLFNQAGFKDVRMSYAEHPYVSAIYDDIEIDIVLCFDLSSDYLKSYGPLTAVDRTPHHSHYILQNLSKEQKEDVRLLKYFFKCHYCYGDQSAVGRSGFIGYSAELLIDYYGTLLNLFQNFDKLDNEVIYSTKIAEDERSYYIGKSIEEIRDNYFRNDFLIIIDPTDSNRNVGSSISSRAYYYLNNVISRFLAEPSLYFFQKHPIPLLGEIPNFEFPKQNLFFAFYEVTIEDHYTKYRDKLYSTMDKVIKELSRENTLEERFTDVSGELLFDVPSGNFVLAFYTKTPLISPDFIRIGPKVNDEPYYSKFLSKNPKAYVVGNHLHLQVKREYTSFEMCLGNLLSKYPVKGLFLKIVGNGIQENIPPIASQSMSNLVLHVLPFIK